MRLKRTIGTIVYAAGAALALLLDWPGELLQPAHATSHEIQQWMRFVLIATAIGLPFDFLAFSSRDRYAGSAAEDGVKAVIRAYMLILLASVAIGTLCMATARVFGAAAGVLVLFAVLIFLSLFQYFFLVVASRAQPKNRMLTFAPAEGGELYEANVHVLDVGVKDFTGGFAGLFRFRRLVFPEQDFDDEEGVAPARKSRYWLYEAARGYRMGATLFSISVLLALAVLVLLIPGTGLDAAAPLARFALWTTLICSLISLVLTVPARRIARLGFLMRRRGREWRPMRFSKDIPRISLEPKRPGDPYPEGSTLLTTWPSAFRLGHYLSWGILNLAARLHPLVAGHPSLWVLPPDERTRFLASRVTEELRITDDSPQT